MSEPVPFATPTPVQTPPRLEFTGTASGFFRIWIVNLGLTVLTLGIYSAWAKVRTRQYFYRHLRLGGVSFDYDADPKRILIGRMIVVCFFAAYSLSSSLVPPSAIAFAGIWLVALPWLMVRSIAFHHRHSLHRNVRFRFHGRVGEAFRVYFGGGLLALLSLGLAIPWLIGRLQQFRVANSAYGSCRFAFPWRAGPYYRVCATAFGIFFAAAIVAIGVATGTAIVNGGLSGAGAPAAAPEQPGSMTFIPFMMFWMLGYAASIAFFNAGIMNLLYNQAELAGMRFASSLRGLELLGLYLLCGLAIVFSLGLAIPWALVRIARYRVSRLSLLVGADLEQFVAALPEEPQSALASEAADFFDFDFGL